MLKSSAVALFIFLPTVAICLDIKCMFGALCFRIHSEQRTTADVLYHLLQVQSAHGAPQSRKLIASFNG